MATTPTPNPNPAPTAPKPFEGDKPAQTRPDVQPAQPQQKPGQDDNRDR